MTTLLKSCRRTIAVSFLLATFAFPALHAQQSTPAQTSEANALLERIRSSGSPVVVKELTSGKGTQWRHVVREIEGGSEPWLEVAKSFLSATDAGFTSDIYFALSIALTHNANGVLSMVGPNVPLDKVCSVPYIEPDEKTVQTHRARVRAALQKVTSPELESRKEDCLKAVEQ